jgi:hypothetical protein
MSTGKSNHGGRIPGEIFQADGTLFVSGNQNGPSTVGIAALCVGAALPVPARLAVDLGGGAFIRAPTKPLKVAGAKQMSAGEGKQSPFRALLRAHGATESARAKDLTIPFVLRRFGRPVIVDPVALGTLDFPPVRLVGMKVVESAQQIREVGHAPKEKG